MSGGIAYIYAPKQKLPTNFNAEMVSVDSLLPADMKKVRTLLRKHTNHTGSPLGFKLLNNWINEKQNFLKIIPHEYKKAIEDKMKSQSNDLKVKIKT